MRLKVTLLDKGGPTTLKEDKWLDDRQYARNLIEANLLSGDRALPYYNKKFNKRDLKIYPSRNSLQTMIFQK